MSRKWRSFGLALLGVVLVDQLSKRWARAELDPFEVVPVLGSFLGLTRLDSSGSSFGVLGELDPILLGGILGVGVILVGSLLWRADGADGFAGTALGLILGGALGNGVDRFYLREITDFVRFDLRLFMIPPFNLADTGVALGAGLLLLDIAASEASEAAMEPSMEPVVEESLRAPEDPR